MSRRRRKTQSTSQRILWLLSFVLVGSMVISLIIVALPSGPAAVPTPTLEEPVRPSLTPSPRPSLTPAPTLPAVPSPTEQATEPILGPMLPSETPPAAPTITLTPTLSPTLSPTPSALGVTFAVCGDSRGNPSVFARVLAAVLGDGAEFMVHTGDMVNEGTESQWQDFAEMVAGFPVPIFPVPGNHDGLDGALDGFLAYSGAPAAHYSFDVAQIHLALADSHGGGITARELDWLAQDLSATDQPVKVVVLHHPPFDPDGTDHVMAFGNRRFMALMVEQEVDYVFAGHIHAFAQEERDDVVYTITGGAGAALYGGNHPQAFHHYLRVSVQGEEVLIEVVRV